MSPYLLSELKIIIVGAVCVFDRSYARYFLPRERTNVTRWIADAEIYELFLERRNIF